MGPIEERRAFFCPALEVPDFELLCSHQLMYVVTLGSYFGSVWAYSRKEEVAVLSWFLNFSPGLRRKITWRKQEKESTVIFAMTKGQRIILVSKVVFFLLLFFSFRCRDK